jgi:hypothetical protein
MDMNRTIKAVVCLGMLMAATLALASPAEAHGCTMFNAAGRYGFTLTGVLITSTGAVPAAAVGKAIVDVSGHVTGGESRSVGGGYAEETLTGTLTINNDCTGTMTLEFFEAGTLVRTSVLSVVFVNNLTELQMVQKSLTLPDGAAVPVVITAVAKKQFTE